MYLRGDYMENKLIVANMKMYMNISDINNYLCQIENKDLSNVIFCPTSIYIPFFLKKDYNTGIQNIYFENNGSYTGEISVEQVRDIGVKYVIIGHSERRKYFNEDDNIINKKVLKVLDNNLVGILCVGEELNDKKLNNTKDVLKKQLELGLRNINTLFQNNIIIAYEPCWAIGSGIIPNNDEISDIVDFIKMVVMEKYKIIVKVIYGGSINDNNIRLLCDIRNLDGFMIGGACVEANKFLKILDTVCDSDK